MNEKKKKSDEVTMNGFKVKGAAAGGGSGAFVRRRFVLRETVCRRGTSCRHLQTGSCIFSHVPDGGPSGLCKWFAAGCCKFGDACYRRHKVIPSAEEEDFVSACGDAQPSVSPLGFAALSSLRFLTPVRAALPSLRRFARSTWRSAPSTLAATMR